MTPALRRVWWLVGAATLAVTLWFIWSGRVRDEPAPVDAAKAAPAASRPEVSALSVSESNGLPLTAAHGSDEIELCGGLWVKAKPDGSVDEDDLSRVTHLPAARARLIDDLRADTSDFARAAAVLLGLAGSDYTRLATGHAAAASCSGAECEANQRAAARIAEGRDTLARMATTTNDPRVYALAFNTCGRAPPAEGACQLLNAEQWARLDPGNAAPWLFVLTQAVQHGDDAAQSEALFRISTSTRSDQHFFAVPGLVIDHMPRDEASMPAVLTLASEAIGVASAWSLPGYQALSDLCKTPARRDTNRHQICTAAAELLVEHSDTLLERNVGIGIGTRLGWPDERITRLRGEQLAYVDSLGASSAQTPVDGCTGIRRDLATVGRHARLGEADALRDWVAHSGKRADDFIRAEQESRAQAAAAAASAAAAALAASAASAPG